MEERQLFSLLLILRTYASTHSSKAVSCYVEREAQELRGNKNILRTEIKRRDLEKKLKDYVTTTKKKKKMANNMFKKSW